MKSQLLCNTVAIWLLAIIAVCRHAKFLLRMRTAKVGLLLVVTFLSTWVLFGLIHLHISCYTEVWIPYKLSLLTTPQNVGLFRICGCVTPCLSPFAYELMINITQLPQSCPKVEQAYPTFQKNFAPEDYWGNECYKYLFFLMLGNANYLVAISFGLVYLWAFLATS